MVACALGRQRSPEYVDDYMFDVEGTVLTEDGHPASGATVTLSVQNVVVYEAVTPVKTTKATTDEKGQFRFMYLAHEPEVTYTLTVEKDGYSKQTVAGTTPPPATHSIRLTK